MSTEFEITVRATSIIIQPGGEALDYLDSLIDLMTYEDEFEEQTKVLGFMYDESTDALYLHKGVNLEYLRKTLPNHKIKGDDFHKFKRLRFEYEEIVPPRNDEQVDVINFIAGLNHHSENLNERQLFLIKQPGFGKTYCSGVGLCKFGVKTLIITHRDNIRSQWLKSLHQMSGMGSEYVHEISSTEEIVQIAHNEHDFDYDVYLLTHATFRAGIKHLKSIGEIGNITKNLGIGMKIIDEAHLEFRDTLMMDFCFNVKRNLYLTATGGRSQRDENSIFHHVFSNALYYKPSAFLTEGIPKKWVDYTTVCVNSNVKPAVYRYRVNGGRGMNPASYGKWVIQIDKKKTHLKCCRDILKIIYDKDENAKVLVFMPLIELCGDAAYFFNKELNYDPSFKYDLNIKTINSKNTPRENADNRRADVIVTTIQSCGTGTDIPGITAIISCSPFVSKITAEQVFGRIRYCGKLCYYYDIYDMSVQMDKFWLKSRRKKFKQLALHVRDISWSDDDDKKESS